MKPESKTVITIKTSVNANIEKVWAYWTTPKHIEQWNNASEDWHTPHAENDLRIGGKFLSRMEARDGSMGFDFTGKYNSIKENDHIQYTLDDGRNVSVQFIKQGDITLITETFEPEATHPIEMQKDGWQAILDNFKRYTEGH